MELYVKSRSEGFGPEVKRRILLGTYVLSSGYYDAYYKSAQNARKVISEEYHNHFQKVDVILQPTTPTTAFKIGEKAANPLAMYQSDLMTISVNLAGIPAMSIPAGLDEKGLPVGLQLTADYFKENEMFSVADAMLKGILGFQLDYRKVK
jgi:aspartyl-tRNA(Asn)/glutamyl-tRNA(Gln) amidotransferase subunit A